MPNVYARHTALPNLRGRLDYISNPKRQRENLVAYYDSAANLLAGKFWKMAAAEAQKNFELYGQKTRVRKNRKTGMEELQQCHAVEGREIVIALPVTLLEKMSADEICKTLANEFYALENKYCAVALHYKEKENNLHAHMIFLEKNFLGEAEQKTATRNLFFDENGKRVYKKSEILNEDKEVRPGCRIVRKGEVYSEKIFGPVDQKYSRKKWAKNLKENWVMPLLNGKLSAADGLTYTIYNPSTGELPQQHCGKAITKKIPPQRLRSRSTIRPLRLLTRGLRAEKFLLISL